MKNIQTIKSVLILILLSVGFNLNAQIIVNSTPVTSTCNIGSFGIVTIKVPTEALTGDNIPLNITLPATSSTCVKKVTITTSTNLNFVSSVIPFVGGGTTFTNAAVIDPINGQNFNVMYAFPAGITCNGASGQFNVVIETNCLGVISTCTTTVNVIARAANYWTISKVFVTGNLTCGNSYWRIQATHSNPNGAGLGAYNLSGTITDTATVPVLSPTAPISIGYGCGLNGTYTVSSPVLQNCKATGATITNTATYNLTLGTGCGTMVGSVSATSPALQSPNALLSFSKTAYDSSYGTVFTTGCKGFYYIGIYNNGNTPWNNFTITDNLTIPGISVTSIGLGSGWTETPTGALTGLVSFNNPGVLLPGQSTGIYIYFNITGATSSVVTNTANLSYYGGTGTPPLPTTCPGISCPPVSTAIQNTTATANFTIVAAQAKPRIVKCNEPLVYTPPIKQVGNTIKFHIQVANVGSAPLSTIVTDNLGPTAQNLSVIGTPNYTYYANAPYYNSCGYFGSSVASSGSMYCNMTGPANNPVFNVTGLPGNCNLFLGNILVIEFEATVLPQLSGSKINTAVLTGGLSSSANYTIDKTAELKIRKIADVQTVENGSSFNYILTVTNVGSHPLDHVVVTDNLPSCVQKNGAIIVKKGTSTITNTFVSNLIITINPLIVINPGESFVITIPVKKISGTNCCNDAASATANMVVDLTQINANTPAEEPACVTSSLCCDIPDFQATISIPHTIHTGVYNLNLNAGTTPIQEIEVSMMDYHVTYSNLECKPANMGIFGNLYSPTLTVGGLLINNNNTHSINWGLGSPVVLNHSIIIKITKPAISALDCCTGIVYFCLKVRIKDVNCNVCEKILCGSFNIKDNIIIWNPGPILDKTILNQTKDSNFVNDYKINPFLKNQYESMILDQEQKGAIEHNLRLQQIEKSLNEIEPANRQEFLKIINSNEQINVIDAVNKLKENKTKNLK
jgi:uncharacterized repeat protein (TIGR01451 family)